MSRVWFSGLMCEGFTYLRVCMYVCASVRLGGTSRQPDSVTDMENRLCALWGRCLTHSDTLQSVVSFRWNAARDFVCRGVGRASAAGYAAYVESVCTCVGVVRPLLHNVFLVQRNTTNDWISAFYFIFFCSCHLHWQFLLSSSIYTFILICLL